MLKQKVSIGLMALVVGLLAASAGQGRDLLQNAQADVFVLGGGSTLVDATTYLTAGRTYHSRFELGPKGTVGVAVPFGKLLSVETAFTMGPNNLFLANENIFPHSAPGASLTYPSRTYIGSMSAVVHSPATWRHLRPYAAGGIEYDRFSPTPGAKSTALSDGFGPVVTDVIIAHNDKFGLNLGGGLDRKLTKRLTFRIDFRDHVTGSPAFGLPPVQTLDSNAVFPAKGHAHDLVYTAGILFHVGKF